MIYKLAKVEDLQAVYAIDLSEHKNKTTKDIIRHEYTTCPVGRLKKNAL